MEHSLGAESFDELAVMVGAFRPWSWVRGANGSVSVGTRGVDECAAGLTRVGVLAPRPDALSRRPPRPAHPCGQRGGGAASRR